jgi:hypothetical protein
MLSIFVRVQLLIKAGNIAVIDFRVIEILPDNCTCSDFEFVPQQRNSVRTEGVSVDAEKKTEQGSGRDFALQKQLSPLKNDKEGFRRPRSLRSRSATARLLRLWIRIPPGACMSVCCECCVSASSGLGEELITRPEESYRLWCVVVCDLETSWMRRPWPTGGGGCCCAKSKNKIKATQSNTIQRRERLLKGKVRRFCPKLWMLKWLTPYDFFTRG